MIYRYVFSGNNKKSFIPEMVGPLLEMTLIPETGLFLGIFTSLQYAFSISVYQYA
jgi:hypothetical protein